MCTNSVQISQAEDLDNPDPAIRKVALLALLKKQKPYEVVWLRINPGYTYVGRNARILCTGPKLRMSVEGQIEIQMYSIDSENLEKGWRKVNDHVGIDITYVFEGCYKEPSDPDHPGSSVFRSTSGDVIILTSDQSEVDKANAIFES